MLIEVIKNPRGEIAVSVVVGWKSPHSQDVSCVQIEVQECFQIVQEPYFGFCEDYWKTFMERPREWSP